MSETAVIPHSMNTAWKLPSRGVVGMTCLILAESAIFLIFVVAYVFYIGKSLSGPTPREVLTLPIFATICLLSSSVTVHFAVSAAAGGKAGPLLTLAGGDATLGWHLPWGHGAGVASPDLSSMGSTIKTNLFGTTFYSLVGLHATHVIVGLFMLTLALALFVARAG